MAFDEAAFTSARILALALAASRGNGDARADLEDLLAGIAAERELEAALLDSPCFEVALARAEAALGPSSIVRPSAAASPTTEPTAPHSNAQTRKRQETSSSAPAGESDERQKELDRIAKVVSALRTKAESIGSQVRSSSGSVDSVAHTLSSVVQRVSSASAQLQNIDGAKRTQLEMWLRRVPVVGPTVLAPMAGVILRVLLLAFVVALTVFTVLAVLLLPRGRTVIVNA